MFLQIARWALQFALPGHLHNQAYGCHVTSMLIFCCQRANVVGCGGSASGGRGVRSFVRRSCVDGSAEVAKAMLMALACVDWSSAAAKSRPIGSTPTCVPASPRWIPCAASPGLQDSDLSVQGGNRIVAKQRMTVRPRSAMTLALLRSQEQSKNALAYNQTANASWNRAAALKSIRKWRRHCHGSTLRVPVA